MVSCNLMGGLGNQMFQIAATVSLALENDDKFGFDFEKCNTPLQGNSAIKYQKNFFKKIPEIKNFNHDSFYKEIKFSYDKINYKKNILLEGYFQSEKYFLPHKKNIQKIFEINQEDIKKIKDYFGEDLHEFTCVHVRRGDYLNLPGFYCTCDLDYFWQAIKICNTKKYIFISDDIDWVKKNFISENFYYSNFCDEILDFTLLTLCKNIVISNSTFSWWGAYLNKNENKIVVSPKKWFGGSGHQDYHDIYPDNWIKI